MPAYVQDLIIKTLDLQYVIWRSSSNCIQGLFAPTGDGKIEGEKINIINTDTTIEEFDDGKTHYS